MDEIDSKRAHGHQVINRVLLRVLAAKERELLSALQLQDRLRLQRQIACLREWLEEPRASGPQYQGESFARAAVHRLQSTTLH